MVTHKRHLHYSDVIMSGMASKITGVSIVYSAVCSSADQIKHQSSASLAFVRGIHRWPVNSPHKRPMTRKHLMTSSCIKVLRRYSRRPLNAVLRRAVSNGRWCSNQLQRAKNIPIDLTTYLHYITKCNDAPSTVQYLIHSVNLWFVKLLVSGSNPPKDSVRFFIHGWARS